MDRTYVFQNQKTPVYQLGLEMWRDHVIRNQTVRERLLAILMEMVHKERTGDVINRNIFRSITTMLSDLGQAVYVDDFESPFISCASEFYKVKTGEIAPYTLT